MDIVIFQRLCILAAACFGLDAALSRAAEPFVCRTTLTSEQVETFRRLESAGAYLLPQTQREGPLTPIVIPIAFHVVRHTDGTGHVPKEAIGRALFEVNSAFAPAGMVFCQHGETDFIDDDLLASDTSGTSLRIVNIVPNALNVWFSPGLNGGLSSFTGDPLPGITMVSNLLSARFILAHEVGHYFDLFHTHETFFGAECVNGSNCLTAGDLLCDTPADPGLTNLVFVPACAYIGTQLDSCGGLPFNPAIGNIMSYEDSRCHQGFSPQQIAKARATLLNLRPELLVDNDCNGNESPDACDFVGVEFAWDATRRQPFNAFVSFPDYTPVIYSAPVAGGAVVFTISARADLGAADEWIDLELNGVPVGRVFGADGNDCPPTPDVAQLVVSAATFNAALAAPGANGNIVVRLRPSGSVSDTCGIFPNNSSVDLAVAYPTAFPTDANGSGALDSCDPDCNGNSIPDFDELVAQLSPDCNLNGVPDECDLAIAGAVALEADFENGLPAGWTTSGVFHVTNLCGGTNPSSFAYAGRSNLCKVQPLDVGQLMSPQITIPEGAATLRFRERFRSTNSILSATLLFGDWELRREFFGDGQWYWREIDLRALHGQTGRFTFKFRNALTTATSNLGWQVDDIHLTAGSADCNDNGLADDCDASVVVSEASGQLSPFGAGAPRSFTIVQAPTAQTDVTLSLSARADLGPGPPTRSVRISLNSMLFESVFLASKGHSCPLEPDADQIVMLRDDFNARLASSPTGDAVFDLTVQGPADPFLCNPSFISLSVDYHGATALDGNLNRVPDVCEQMGDMNCDLLVNGLDVSAFLHAVQDPSTFGLLHPGCDLGLGDFNGNGAVEIADTDAFVDALLGPS